MTDQLFHTFLDILKAALDFVPDVRGVGVDLEPNAPIAIQVDAP